ncbi:NAD(P)/FAD-dependent oxidoreductase, partial [Streptomyces rochei]|nr:NAD(P)/FAD-dependent oxidoreductase [Streptomyces rochei]
REAELDALFGPAARAPERPTVTVLRPDDPALVPDADHEAVTVTSVVPAGGGASAEEAEEYEAHAGRLVRAAERAVP